VTNSPDLNGQRLALAHEADRGRQAMYRGRGRSSAEEGIDAMPGIADGRDA
jgi:hypothetical protein